MSMYAEVQGSTLIRFPYTHGSLMEENPFTNYGNDPDLMAIFPNTDTAVQNNYELVEVTWLPAPEIDPKTEKLKRLDPAQIDGRWVVGWVVRPKTDEELANDTASRALAVRADRNARLAECDWTQLADAPGDKVAWTTYRQALRDAPAQAGFPWDVAWPTKP
jgi:Phage tail assembly chaperone protein